MSRELFTASEVGRLTDAGAHLVEVLPAKEYAEQHLPGAINIPLRDIDAEIKQRLDPTAKVIVYCWDTACDLSPRAAALLDDIGFVDVYDYVPGKLDWLARGLPVEGTSAGAPTAGTVARRGAPTCGPRERVGEVKGRLGDWPLCIVVNESNVVFGVLRSNDLARAEDKPAVDAMLAGPSTYRPNVPIEEMAERMTKHDIAHAPITSLDGTLIGVLFRDDAVDSADA